MEQFRIVSTVRKQATRLVRKQQNAREIVQFISGQHRLIPNRDLVFSKDQVLQYRAELKARQQAGSLKVTSLAGQPVDLDTLEAAELPCSAPTPEWPVDCLVTSKENEGRFNAKPPMQGGIPMQELIDSQAADAAEEGDEESGEGVVDETASQSVADIVLNRGRNRRRR